MTAHFDAINFQELIHLFPATDMGFEDLNSFLEIISQSNIIRNQLSSFLTITDDTDKKSVTDPKVLITSPGAMSKNIFLQMMLSIVNPVISGISSLLFVLSLLWSLIRTILALRLIFSFF